MKNAVLNIKFNNYITIIPKATYPFALFFLPLPTLFPTIVHAAWPNPNPIAYTADAILKRITYAAFSMTLSFDAKKSRTVYIQKSKYVIRAEGTPNLQ